MHYAHIHITRPCDAPNNPHDLYLAIDTRSTLHYVGQFWPQIYSQWTGCLKRGCHETITIESGKTQASADISIELILSDMPSTSSIVGVVCVLESTNNGTILPLNYRSIAAANDDQSVESNIAVILLWLTLADERACGRQIQSELCYEQIQYNFNSSTSRYQWFQAWSSNYCSTYLGRKSGMLWLSIQRSAPETPSWRYSRIKSVSCVFQTSSVYRWKRCWETVFGETKRTGFIVLRGVQNGEHIEGVQTSIIKKVLSTGNVETEDFVRLLSGKNNMTWMLCCCGWRGRIWCTAIWKTSLSGLEKWG